MTSFYEGACLWKITSSKTLFFSNHCHLFVGKHSSVINSSLETREQTEFVAWVSFAVYRGFSSPPPSSLRCLKFSSPAAWCRAEDHYRFILGPAQRQDTFSVKSRVVNNLGSEGRGALPGLLSSALQLEAATDVTTCASGPTVGK